MGPSWMTMTFSSLFVLVFCISIPILNARVLNYPERYYRHGERVFNPVARDENEIDLDRLEMFRRLWTRISEDDGRRDGGKYSDYQEASNFTKEYDILLQRMSHEESLANWNYSTNITESTGQWRDNVTLKWLPEAQKASEKASEFYKLKKAFAHDEDLVRRLKIISRCGSRPSSDDARMTEVLTQLETIYSSASVRDDEGQNYKLDPGLTELMETSRDYEKLKWAWQSWRDASGKLMKDLYTESVRLQNGAAHAAGFEDLGGQWRACNYEEPEERTADNSELFVEDIVDDLHTQIEPLYEELHAFVRYKLRQQYPDQKEESWFKDDDSPIPAHLLGNEWAQQWMIDDLVKPFPDVDDIDVSNTMREQDWTVQRMFREAEEFFKKMGLPEMTEVFWEKSMFTRPTDGREVVCHASAEDFSTRDDFRIKMCAEVKQSDLQTIHHEMGHIEYFMLYSRQDQIYRQGANSAFHEAIGDTIALSVMTPGHLQKLGLLARDSNAGNEDKWKDYLKRDINFLMKMALEKVAFLPFGYLVDKWRWDVYSGKITPENYNRKWWEYRIKYQGIAPPVTRSEEDFDPGAKYHVAANVPYIRYFLSFIGQFQFHKALCDAKHHSGKLYTCDIYESREAGKHLRETLELGSSVHWPEAMKKLTGQEKFDATAITIYFRPLMDWLREYRTNDGNERYKKGWKDTSDVLRECFTS